MIFEMVLATEKEEVHTSNFITAKIKCQTMIPSRQISKTYFEGGFRAPENQNKRKIQAENKT